MSLRLFRNAAVAAGNTLGSVTGAGLDNTSAVRNGASIQFVNDSNSSWTSTGSPGAAGRINFNTTANGSLSPTVRMILDNAGKLWIAPTISSNTVSSGTASIDQTGNAFFAGSMTVNRVTKTTTYTTLTTDYVVECTSGSFTVTLSSTNNSGQIQVISNSGAGTITVAAGGGKTLNGPTSVATHTAQQYVGDGAGNWAAAS